MGDWIGELLAWLEPWLAYLLGLMGESSVLGLGAAALAGVALGLSPVTYLFMPAVVGYAGGKSTTRGRAAVLSLAFVLGITTVYMVLGALWGSIGQLLLASLRSSLWLWYGLGAAALLLMGLRMVGLLRFNVPLLGTPNPEASERRGFAGAYLLGLPFGLAGCPSCEPIRLAVLTAVAANTQPLMGALAMLAVGLGQGLILVAAGAYVGTLPNLKRFASYRVAINRSLGLLLLLVATYFAWRAIGYLV